MKTSLKVTLAVVFSGGILAFVFAQTVNSVPRSITLSIDALNGTPVILDYYANGHLVQEAVMNGTTNVFNEYAAKSPTDPTMDMEINWVEILTKKAYHAEYTIDPSEIEYWDEEKGRISVRFEIGPNGEIRASYEVFVGGDEIYEEYELIHGCVPKMGEGDKVFKEFREYSWGKDTFERSDEAIQFLTQNGNSLQDEVVIYCEDE